LEIELEDTVHGLEKEITFTKLDTCTECHGRGAAEGSKAETLPDVSRPGPGGPLARFFTGRVHVPAL